MLPAHIVADQGHGLSLTVAAIVISGVGIVSLTSAFLERRGRLDGTVPSVPFDRWSAVIAAGWSMGAAAIHFSVIGEHLAIAPAEGVLFVIVAWFQLAWAVWFAARPRPLLAFVGAVVNLGVVGVWSWSRAMGFPFGSHAGVPEPVAVNDAIATAFEIALVATLVVRPIVRRGRGQRLSLPSSTALAWTGSALVVVIVLASVGIVQGSSHDHPPAGIEPGHELPGEPGTVTFGTNMDPEGGVVDPTSSLPAIEDVLWVAVFTEPAGSEIVEFVILQVDASGAEVELAREDVFLSRPEIQSLTEVRDLASIGGPGTYRIRYLLGDEVLAEGDVTLIP